MSQTHTWEKHDTCEWYIIGIFQCDSNRCCERSNSRESIISACCDEHGIFIAYDVDFRRRKYISHREWDNPMSWFFEFPILRCEIFWSFYLGNTPEWEAIATLKIINICTTESDIRAETLSSLIGHCIFLIDLLERGSINTKKNKRSKYRDAHYKGECEKYFCMHRSIMSYIPSFCQKNQHIFYSFYSRLKYRKRQVIILDRMGYDLIQCEKFLY